MPAYDAYHYHHSELDHYGHAKYKHGSSTSHYHSYGQQPQFRPQGGSQKKRFVEGGHQYMIPKDNKTGSSLKLAQQKRGFTETPPTQLAASQQLQSEEVSTIKTNQLLLPIEQEDEDPPRRAEQQYYPLRTYIPLIQEEDHDGYEDPYSIHQPNNQHQLANQGFPNLGPMHKGDSPSNYKPFGTHFGPRIINRYGGHADFLTPQAKNFMPRQYGNLPGDTSSKSSPFKKSGLPVAKTQPVISQGFSSLAEQVVKQKDGSMHDDGEENSDHN